MMRCCSTPWGPAGAVLLLTKTLWLGGEWETIAIVQRQDVKPEVRQGGGAGGEDWGRGGWSIRKDNSEMAALRGKGISFLWLQYHIAIKLAT